MIIIDYNPATQIPPIAEKDIDNKIIISVFKDINLYMAVKVQDRYFKWFGCSIGYDRWYSLASIPEFCRSGFSNSLINLLIRDYKETLGQAKFYILEDIFDVEFIVNKFNLREVNKHLLHMLQGNAKIVFSKKFSEVNNE